MNASDAINLTNDALSTVQGIASRANKLANRCR